MDSQLKYYSVGRAAENKALDSKKLQITPIEQLTMLDGELKSNPTQPEASGVDAQGASYSSKVTVDTAVEATWYPMSSNRKTPPDIRRGERVIIWRYADTDKFYWTETGWDDHLRRLETVIYTFSGVTDEAADATEPDNCYYLEVSTHTGQITLQTSKKNNEYCRYVVQINTKNGCIVVTDDVGNEMVLDSKNTLIAFTNALKTTLQLDKQKIYAHADDSITLDAKNLIHFTTKDFKMECSTVTVKNDTTLFNTTTTEITGDVTIDKTLTVKGQATFQDSCTFNGTVKFNQPIQANGITSTAPIQGPSQTI